MEKQLRDELRLRPGKYEMRLAKFSYYISELSVHSRQ